MSAREGVRARGRVLAKAAAVVVSCVVLVCASALMLAGCNGSSAASDAYRHVSVEEVKQIMEEPGSIIVDVRGEVAFDMGHIPGAICIRGDDLNPDEVAKLLPDKDQAIIVYCDYGGLSKIVAGKLADLGYTNIVEFDGIEVWDGELE